MILRPLLLAALLTLPSLPAPAQSAADRVHAIGEDMLEREYDLAPLFETYAQGAGPRAGRAILDLEGEPSERYRALYRDILGRLTYTRTAQLGDSERIALRLLRHHADSQLARHEHPLRAMQMATPIRDPAGVLVALAASAQPFRDAADFDAWLARVEASGAVFDHAIRHLEAAAARQWTAPRALAQKTLAQVEGIAGKSAREGPLWAPVARFPAGAGPDARADFERRYAAALDERLLPAMRRFADYLRDKYIPRARTTAGIGTLPGGDRAYRAAIRGYTTLDLAPEQVHALGLAEAERIRPKLIEAARKVGFKGELGALGPWLDQQPANHPFRSGEEVLAYLRQLHGRVAPGMSRLFHRLPRAPFEIHLAPAAIAATASASYLRPTPDGSRPGVFQMPVPDPLRTPRHSLAPILLHEGMPGHHLDGGLNVELDQPRYRKSLWVTAYGEGWGLYAESLGHELGAYDDPWALVGRYALEIRRAARLVTDSGLHWKGWSREEAIAYLRAHGITAHDATVEVERYMADPGQALAYKVGEIEILKLREEARKTMGAGFDLRDFHQAVLAEGPVTLEVLRERVRAWSRAPR